jgi:hypothetical protein
VSADLSIRLSAASCPTCRVPAALARDTAYCLKCGWNRSAARRQIVFGAFWAAAYLAIGAYILSGGLGGFGWTVSAVFLVLMAFTIKNIFTLWSDWKVLCSSNRRTFGEIRFEVDTPVPQYGQTSLIDSIGKLPRPRAVRFTEDAKSSIWVYGIVGALMASLFGFGTMRNMDAIRQIEQQGLVVLMMLAIVVLPILAVLLRFRRDKRLVSDGELGVARVTRQWFLRFKGTHSNVSYAFEPESNKIIKGSFQDNSKSIFPGMEIIVYYDRDRPRKHVAGPDAIYEPYDPSSEFEPIG